MTASDTLEQSIQRMSERISSILHDQKPSLYLFGSVALDDFRLGWSDIDILCLTEQPITPAQAENLVNLRQTMLAEAPSNRYYRSFEGGITSAQEFLTAAYERVVYWGTSGQRITQQYAFDAFSMYELMTSGVLLCGPELRSRFTPPSPALLRQAVAEHYRTIRQYAVVTASNLYACGWLLDIARCLYTWRTGRVIAKTQAGYWALEQRLCPVEAEIKKTLAIRECPDQYKGEPETDAWLSSLGPAVQRFADVLEAEMAL